MQNEIFEEYGVMPTVVAIGALSMIPAGLALFIYTFDVRWLIMCMPILLLF